MRKARNKKSQLWVVTRERGVRVKSERDLRINKHKNIEIARETTEKAAAKRSLK